MDSKKHTPRRSTRFKKSGGGRAQENRVRGQKDKTRGQENLTRGQENTLRGQKNRGVRGLKNKVRGQKNQGSEKQVSRGSRNRQGLKK